MKKSIPSNTKIKCILLNILFSVLFILTALNISNPITAYADDSGILQSTPNGKAVNGTEVDSTSTANYLFWAASEDRTGILFYIIDNTGCLYGDKKLLIMDDKSVYRKASKQDGFTTMLTNAAGVEVGDKNILGLTTPSGYSTKPVTYSDGWHATGNVNTLLNATTTLSDGREVPYWFKYASILINTEGDIDIVINDILASDSHWAIVAEPVSIQYIYSNSAYNTGGTDTLGHVYEAGDPLPAGSDPNSTDATPYIFCGTARGLTAAQTTTTWFDYCSPNPDDGGTYTYKFLNMALPWSMCLEHDQSIALWNGGGSSARVPWSAPTGNGEQLSSRYQIAYPTYATGIYFIDVSVMRPPIHTFGGTTPGNTEKPDPPKDGDCTIKKLYYTQIISSDGTIIEEATDYHHFEQSGTTNYISIDNEEGYEIEGWKTSDSSSSLTTKEQFTSISASRNGSSSETITLDADTGEKYLYVLLKKTEIDDTPHEDYDFRLEQSQITKRVTFLEGMGPANTPDLITHNFTWTAPAPTITSCTAHGGYGHHLKCDKVWDVAPVEGVPHNHASHSDEISYYACGYTYSCAAGCTKSHTHHTHSDSCIGYKKLTHTTLCPSGCTTRHTHHFSHTDSCYTVCNKVWDTEPIKR